MAAEGKRLTTEQLYAFYETWNDASLAREIVALTRQEEQNRRTAERLKERRQFVEKILSERKP